VDGETGRVTDVIVDDVAKAARFCLQRAVRNARFPAGEHHGRASLRCLFLAGSDRSVEASSWCFVDGIK
jgi:hypothetical protein